MKKADWRVVSAVSAVVALATSGIVVSLVVGDGREPTIGATPYSPPPTNAASADPDHVFLAWGPSEGDLDRALATAQGMTLDEAAGQVIVTRYSGTNPSGLANLIRTYHVGGVTLGSGNIGARAQTEGLIASARTAWAEQGHDWPFIVATDQEGGTVARLNPFIPNMPSFMASGAANDKTVVRQAWAGVGRDMAALDVNVDFAPDADVTVGLADPIIRTRSAGSDPENVGRTAIAAFEGLLDGGVIPAVKHFPGHGNVTTDSHILTPSTTKSVAQLRKSDFVPFQEAIDAGVPMIMMAHIVVPEWGPTPASINPNAYDYLRDEMGFTGVTVTDSLGMGALLPFGGTGQNSVAALNAGADLLLMPATAQEAHDAIVSAVTNGTLSRDRLNDAAAHVIALMRYQQSLIPAPGAGGDYVRALSEASATVVTPLCGTRLVGSTVSVSGGTASERSTLLRALAAYGVPEGARGTTIRLLTGPTSSGTADIVVALDGPWGISASHATTYIGLYGHGPSTLAALADILVNAVDANAHWPVPVPGLPYRPCPSPR